MDPKEIVRTGYDRVADAYTHRYAERSSDVYRDWLIEVVRYVPRGSRVLDLGCGNGVPVAQSLAADFSVVGVDISSAQVARARLAVPTAEFYCADMTRLGLPENSFGAIIALYSIIHVPLVEQRDLFRSISAWLKPAGCLLAVVGQTAWTGIEEHWLGVDQAKMYWSHADAETYERWLVELDFELLRRQHVLEGHAGHTMLFAKKKVP